MGGTMDQLQKLMKPVNTAMQDVSGPAAIASGIGATAMGNPQVGLPLMAGGVQSTASPGSPSTMNPALLSQMMGGSQKQQTPQPQYAPRPPMTSQNMGQQMAPPKPNPAPPVPQMAQPPQNAQSMQAMIAK